MNTYLIPANTKKGVLILGIFRPFDLILFLTGVFVTLILLMAVDLSSMVVTVIVLLPAMICSFLIMPIPYYHNLLQIIISAYQFFTNRQKFIWKGWDFNEEARKEK